MMTAARKKSLVRLDELDEEMEALLTDLERYDEEALNRVPEEGGWTALQTLHHLMLAENYAVAYLEKKILHGGEFAKSDLMEWVRMALLDSYLVVYPRKVKAPSALTGENLPKKSTLEKVRRQWSADRIKLRRFLSEADENLFDRQIFKHPFAGRFNFSRMVRFLRGHLRHHRKQALSAAGGGW
ncbi:MAG: DinB family protein [Saprospiraceae bacterium]